MQPYTVMFETVLLFSSYSVMISEFFVNDHLLWQNFSLFLDKRIIWLKLWMQRLEQEQVKLSVLKEMHSTSYKCIYFCVILRNYFSFFSFERGNILAEVYWNTWGRNVSMSGSWKMLMNCILSWVPENLAHHSCYSYRLRLTKGPCT
jgi:hypothetical protein